MSDPKGRGMLASAARVVLDGWNNVLTGLGLAARDKRMSAAVEYMPVSEIEAEQLYAGDDVAAKFVDVLPEDAIRQWLTFKFPEDGVAKAVDDELTALGLANRLETAWKWARQYGGAAIFINADDSRDPSQPLVPGLVRKIKALTVLSRWELVPATIDVNLDSTRYGQPETYVVQARRTEAKMGKGEASVNGLVIHWSRLVRFDGVVLPLRLAISNQYWGESVFARTQNAIRNYQIANDAAATVLNEFNQGVFKIKGLADMLRSGQDALIQARLQTINLARSVCRAVVIDGDEEFLNVGAALTGVPDVLDRVAARLVVASGMPHTKLLGESPSGLGATGKSELRDWYDYVSNQQELILRPAVQWLVSLVLQAKQGPTRGKLPPEWSFEFNSLWQMDEGEAATARKTQAETDAIYIERGVATEDEIAASRFGQGGYSFETTVDLEARGRMRKASDDEPADDEDEDEGDDASAKNGAA